MKIDSTISRPQFQNINFDIPSFRLISVLNDVVVSSNSYMIVISTSPLTPGPTRRLVLTDVIFTRFSSKVTLNVFRLGKVLRLDDS